MSMALRIAAEGKGATFPNPAVGAIIAKNRRIIGCGYHPKAGFPHAEIYALQQAGTQAKNATLFITLEPCCHYGKTPPCVSAIINAGIKNVSIATADPNPIIHKQGIAALINAGITVTCGILEQEAQFLNRDYFTFHMKKRPYVRMKFAMTLDGKIASSQKKSKWLSTEQTRYFTHRLRALSDAILVGSQTIIHDNPQLDVRINRKHEHLFYRIILDPLLETPPASNLFKVPLPVLLFAQHALNKNNKICYPENCEIIPLPVKNNLFDLHSIMNTLHKKNIQSILVEGGAATISNFLEKNLADELYVIISPHIMGGSASLNFAAFLKERLLDSMISLSLQKIFTINKDIIIQYTNTLFSKNSMQSDRG
ncbi:MAG: riboflavin biosynthesis protein RibD [Candidatus Fischerbacteria bacterium RBG_13_37_8]|uniref:Riboflavin biosynthesis protein RibD n=1 Tax=Candidatus Fischerbacteria bacterium RBG_13_37_8 TaxID=1817863 RepID=A0A1F5VR48_9BACT|nr:MAG: riboflavin biosynthesis protein RibD [Candidatus Fischerbacteria bacterium RBG_13_37_8]